MKAAKSEKSWWAKIKATMSNDRLLVKIFAGATALLVLFIIANDLENVMDLKKE